MIRSIFLQFLFGKKSRWWLFKTGVDANTAAATDDDDDEDDYYYF